MPHSDDREGMSTAQRLCERRYNQAVVIFPDTIYETSWWLYNATMVRSQIQLTEEQHRRLKRWARKLGISIRIDRRHVSLVDAVSFTVMEMEGVTEVLGLMWRSLWSTPRA